MASLELLDKEKHAKMRVDTQKTASYGDNVNGCLVVPEEFLQAHKEYPIYFQKDAESGDFQALVLFGFKQDENLFLGEAGWSDSYLPALMRREPFYIGFQKAPNSEQRVPVVHVDVESARITSDEFGEPVFNEDGSGTEFLTNVSKVLNTVHEGLAAGKMMFDKFLEHDLIEQFVLDIVFDDGTQFKTGHYYTIHRENLYKLSDEAVGELHRGGFLQLAYMVLESLGNVNKLIERKNKNISS